MFQRIPPDIRDHTHLPFSKSIHRDNSLVLVVANPIFDPFRLDAASITPWATAVLARGRCLKLGVAAKTFLAVSVNIFNSTAVATIPVAATKVVHVIWFVSVEGGH